MRAELFVVQTTWAAFTEAAMFAEEAGFDAIASPEIAHDPFIPLALAAQKTERLGLRTAIAVAFPRSPMVTANLAWDLHVESGGRFALGLGTQIQAHIERRFSSSWTKPRSQLREYVQAVRAIHRSWEKREKLRFEGEHYRFSLMTPEFSPAPSGLAPVPILTAAVRPAMIELAGEVADGVRLHGFMTRRYLDQVAVPALEKGLASRGRPRSRFEVCGGGFVATGPDEAAVAKMREVIRYRVGFYASTPAYWPVLEAHGQRELGERLRALTLAGRWGELAAQVPDELLAEFCVAATFRDLAPALEKRFGGVVDSIELALPLETPVGEARELLSAVHGIPTLLESAATSWDEIPSAGADPARAHATPHV